MKLWRETVLSIAASLQLTAMSAPVAISATADGRNEAQKRCAPLACAWEHCMQQRKYNTAACAASLELWEECLSRERGGVPAPKR